MESARVVRFNVQEKVIPEYSEGVLVDGMHFKAKVQKHVLGDVRLFNDVEVS